ncbi:MAG: nascent polypeptide-associated complex protein, partial [halophilic archaeon J07HB67]
MFGGGGMDPRKMEQMMKQMGIDMDELDAESVVIVTEDEELVFDAPQVTKMDAQGQETYQIVGSPETHQVAGGDDAELEAGDADEQTTVTPRFRTTTWSWSPNARVCRRRRPARRSSRSTATSRPPSRSWSDALVVVGPHGLRPRV